MKICNKPNCHNPVFSHGYCKYHYRYKPKKSKNNESQVDIFDKVWNSRPHISELSGAPLDKYVGTDLYYSMFMHILPKGNYPLFKHEEDNILLGDPMEHHLIDHGCHDDREEYNETAIYPANWDIFYQKKEYLKEKYREAAAQIL